MFDGMPEGWDASRYRIRPAPAGRLLEGGDVVDLGDRAFEVIHTPGHSPGGIALYERKTGILLSGDIVYDGPLIDDVYHSRVDDYVETLEPHARACRLDRARRAFPELRRDALPPAHRRLSRRQTPAGLPSLKPASRYLCAESGGISVVNSQSSAPCRGWCCDRRL